MKWSGLPRIAYKSESWENWHGHSETCSRQMKSYIFFHYCQDVWYVRCSMMNGYHLRYRWPADHTRWLCRRCSALQQKQCRIVAHSRNYSKRRNQIIPLVCGLRSVPVVLVGHGVGEVPECRYRRGWKRSLHHASWEDHSIRLFQFNTLFFCSYFSTTFIDCSLWLRWIRCSSSCSSRIETISWLASLCLSKNSHY
jgi:hypothetical protein